MKKETVISNSLFLLLKDYKSKRRSGLFLSKDTSEGRLCVAGWQLFIMVCFLKFYKNCNFLNYLVDKSDNLQSFFLYK